MIPILLLLIAIPVVGALASFLSGNKWANELGASVAVLNLFLGLISMHYYLSGTQLSESYLYVPTLNIYFELSMSSVSLFLVLLTLILFVAAATSNIYFVKEDKNSYNALFLLAEAATLGLFMSANLFFFYIFWDIAVVILFFILSKFGGYDRRYAAFKFFIYSVISSSMLLIAIILMYSYSPAHSFSIQYLEASGPQIPKDIQLIAFLLLIFAFMIKVPVFPFHSWAPDAYAEAPPSGSIILSGVLSKFGAYGVFLMFSILPIAREFNTYLMAVFTFSVIYAAFVGLAQKELKKMLTYLSIAEMGIIAFGLSALNTLSTEGALFGMLSHALIISLLFLIAFAIEKVFGTTSIPNLKGIANSNRALTYYLLFGVLAAVGLPLTTGFVTEFLIFLGGVKSFGLIGILPLAGVFINGAYLFWLLERSFFSTSAEMEIISETSRSAYAAVATLLSFIIAFGVFPHLLLNIAGASI